MSAGAFDGLRDRLLWRLVPGALLVASSVVWGWDFLVQSLGQGTQSLLAGWWASMLGAVMLTTGLWVPLAGVAGAALVAFLLRLRPPREPLDAAARTRLGLGAWGLFALALAAPFVVLWQVAPPVRSAHARFDAAFIWTSALLLNAVAVMAAMACVRLLAGPPPALPPATASAPY